MICTLQGMNCYMCITQPTPGMMHCANMLSEQTRRHVQINIFPKLFSLYDVLPCKVELVAWGTCKDLISNILPWVLWKIRFKSLLQLIFGFSAIRHLEMCSDCILFLIKMLSRGVSPKCDTKSVKRSMCMAVQSVLKFSSQYEPWCYVTSSPGGTYIGYQWALGRKHGSQLEMLPRSKRHYVNIYF